MQDESSNLKTMNDPVQAPRRCASCGGLNPPSAAWCGQCLTRFDLPTEPQQATDVQAQAAAVPEAPVQEALAQEGPAQPSAPAHPLDQPRSPVPAQRPAAAADVPFRVTEEGITWTCSICETVNDLERLDCDVCGAPFAKTVLPEEEKPQRDPNMVALISLFLPGAGHAYLGHWGQAIARGVISLWVIMVVFVAALQRGAASSNLVMVVFGVVATGLWAVAAHDAYREARGERALVILKGKIFFYLVLGLILLLVALLMSAMIKANG